MAVEAGGIGARLRAGREKLGLTVLQVAERIHTDPKIVEAIEAENFEALGAPVYARGHIRHYADLVGESANELTQIYSNLNRVAQPDLTRIVKAPARPEANKLVAPALVVIAVFAVAGAIWWLAALSSRKPQMSESHVVTDEVPPASSSPDAAAAPEGGPAPDVAGGAPSSSGGTSLGAAVAGAPVEGASPAERGAPSGALSMQARPESGAMTGAGNTARRGGAGGTTSAGPTSARVAGGQARLGAAGAGGTASPDSASRAATSHAAAPTSRVAPAPSAPTRTASAAPASSTAARTASAAPASSTAARTASAAPASSTAARTASAAPASSTPTRTASAALASSTARRTASAATVAATPEPLAAARPKNQSSVTLRYSADSWTEVYDASGARLFYDVGAANSVKTVVGTPPLRVVLGNASGVSVEYNGHSKPVAKLSQPDGSVQFSITRSGEVVRAKPAADGG